MRVTSMELPAQHAGRLETLCRHFVAAVPDVVAVKVADLHGQVVTMVGAPGIDEAFLVEVSATVQPILVEMQDQFSFKNFGTASFETDAFRLIFVDPGHGLIVAIALDQMGSIDQTMPFAFLLAEKVAQVVERNPLVQLTVPSIVAPAVAEHPRVKNHLYQLRLKEGNFNYKFLLVGDAGVGKTALIVRFVEGGFKEDYRSTIGLNVLSHDFQLVSKKTTHLTLFFCDVGSQPHFRRVRRSYYLGTHTALVVFDIASRASFEHVPTWKKELEACWSRAGIALEECPLLLVGNKLDLAGQREVSRVEGVAMARQIGASYMETSAKTGEHVDDAIRVMAYKLLEREMAAEESLVKQDLAADFRLVLQNVPDFQLAIVGDNPFWNPFLDFFLNFQETGILRARDDVPAGQIFRFAQNLTLKNVIFEPDAAGDPIAPVVTELADCHGIIFLFYEQEKRELEPLWKGMVRRALDATRARTVIAVGIGTRHTNTWLRLVEEFNINDALETHPEHSVFFFRVSPDYRLEVLDNLKTFFNAFIF